MAPRGARERASPIFSVTQPWPVRETGVPRARCEADGSVTGASSVSSAHRSASARWTWMRRPTATAPAAATASRRSRFIVVPFVRVLAVPRGHGARVTPEMSNGAVSFGEPPRLTRSGWA
ncbi:hypothetical protein BJY21_002203 [Kineosphaera limosa]|nr:hypothetical protein [Kineosphaera limosa]